MAISYSDMFMVQSICTHKQSSGVQGHSVLHATRHILEAQCAFKILMIHEVLQFALRIAFRCVLHRCGSHDIRCWKLYTFSINLKRGRDPVICFTQNPHFFIFRLIVMFRVGEVVDASACGAPTTSVCLYMFGHKIPTKTHAYVYQDTTLMSMMSRGLLFHGQGDLGSVW